MLRDDRILDFLLLVIRLPRMVISFIRKEKTVISEVEEKLDQTADIVDSAAKAVEDVAKSVEKVAEAIDTDAKATEELMRKVEATSETIKSDVDHALGSLENALGPDDATVAANPTENMDSLSQPKSSEIGKTVSQSQGKPMHTKFTAPKKDEGVELSLGMLTPAPRGCHKSSLHGNLQQLGSKLLVSNNIILYNNKAKDMGWRLLNYSCFMAFMVVAVVHLRTPPSLLASTVRVIFH